MLRTSLTFITILTISIIANYKLFSYKKSLRLSENAKKINHILTDNFEQTEKIMIFIGYEISKNAPTLELKSIHDIFVKTAYITGYNNIFSWSLFDWVDKEGNQTVNTMLGINKTNSADVNDRYYSLRGGEKWKIIFSKPIIGTPSKMLVIPVGVQIETKKYPQAGTVVLGINIQKLINAVETRLDSGVEFALVDKRDDSFTFTSRGINNNFSKSDLNPKTSSSYIEEMEQKYPYKILVKYDESKFKYEFLYSSLCLIMQVISVFAAVLLLKKKR